MSNCERMSKCEPKPMLLQSQSFGSHEYIRMCLSGCAYSSCYDAHRTGLILTYAMSSKNHNFSIE